MFTLINTEESVKCIHVCRGSFSVVNWADWQSKVTLHMSRQSGQCFCRVSFCRGGSRGGGSLRLCRVPAAVERRPGGGAAARHRERRAERPPALSRAYGYVCNIDVRDKVTQEIKHWISGCGCEDNVALLVICHSISQGFIFYIKITLCVSSSSRVRGVEPDGGGLRQAAVPAGAVPEGSVPPAVSQQAVRGRRPAALAQTLQVRFLIIVCFFCSFPRVRVPSLCCTKLACLLCCEKGL